MRQLFLALAGVLLAVGWSLATGASALAATWTGAGGDDNWSTPQNWSGNTVPVNGDDLVFPTGASRLINNNNLVGLTVDTITFPGSGYSISGNAISLRAAS